MFDVSFSELLVIIVVGLLVIGPEKLPKVARTLGALTGRLQRYAAMVKEEVNREERFQELQNLQQEIKQGFKEATSGLEQELQTIADVPKEKAQTKVNAKAKAKPKAKPVNKTTTKKSRPKV